MKTRKPSRLFAVLMVNAGLVFSPSRVAHQNDPFAALSHAKPVMLVNRRAWLMHKIEGIFGLARICNVGSNMVTSQELRPEYWGLT